MMGPRFCKVQDSFDCFSGRNQVISKKKVHSCDFDGPFITQCNFDGPPKHHGPRGHCPPPLGGPGDIPHFEIVQLMRAINTFVAWTFVKCNYR